MLLSILKYKLRVCSIDFHRCRRHVWAMKNAPDIVTANRLRDGAVVYWNRGAWAEALAGAEIIADPAATKAALAAAAAFVTARQVVGVYAFKVRLEDGIAVPLEEREVIRACGPSVIEALGKQADPATAPLFDRAPKQAMPAPKEAKGPEAFDVSL